MITTLIKASKILNCHPRTILRALTGKANPYWIPEHNVELNVQKIANAFNADGNKMFHLFNGLAIILKPEEAAKVLGIASRTFREHAYQKFINHGGVVRFLRHDLELEHIARFVKETF